jgi:osmoprotectant transport system substrate-binding protein
MRRWMLVVGLFAGVVVLTGVAVQAYQGRVAPPEVERLRIGVNSDAESVLLGHIIAELLGQADIAAEVVSFAHFRDVRRAIVLDEIDLMPTYTGAVHLDVHGFADPAGDPRTSYEAVRAEDARRGLLWLAPSGVNATFAFFVDPEVGEEVDTLEDLTLLNTDPDALLCVDEQYASRPDGLAEVARIYAIDVEVITNQVLPVSPREAIAAVTRGDCVAGLSFATDGHAWNEGLRALADPGRVMPAFIAAAVVREEVLEAEPGIEEALTPFTYLSTRMLAAANGRVILGDPPDVVAVEVAETLLAIQAEAEAEDEEDDAPG